VSGALARFRVMAVLVGIGLIVLFFVAVPLRYLAGHPEFSEFFSPIHGLLYMVYLGTVLDLSRRAGWSLLRTVGVMLAGTVPFLSFVVERRVAEDVARVA
jgi:integral membrane protein